MTKQRKLVLTIVENSCDHLTAEEVFFLAKQEMPNIALGTVYRNLNILVEEGILRRLSIAGHPDRFDNTKVEHEHLVCKNCGKLQDFKIEGVRELLTKAAGTSIDNYELNAYYICKECSNQEV